ncbi:M20/M25/M40 family metallo-hydrolase [Effusibacillus pohliae]|uniref:M20/M25/M40 family metallo-hydrolase n=1 Tax=Effusibacillus pohliae TaxID=232270 RepID=UPI000361EFCA|nr:M20/M25/M40 family metallo-hydrolase [Effusibacillus pohliae]
MAEVNEQRLVDRFLQMVRIDSPSSHEREIADYLRQELESLGFEVEEDDAGRDLLQMLGDMRGAETIRFAGNLIARKKGTVHQAAPILFAAHMDTVVSNKGVVAKVEEGVIRTDGRTILGADDKAGIAAMLEAAHVLREHQLPHGDLEYVFTIAEETGLNGSRLLDKKKLRAKFGFVMDSGGPPHVVIGASPTEIDFTIKIYGKAAHSGVNPEDGISAIAAAGLGISHVRMGRIDEETTVNIGVIKGGERTNIVCDYVEMWGEARSRNEDKLAAQLSGIQSAFAMACEKFGARFEMEEQKIYSGFNLSEDDDVVRLAFAGVRKAGMNPELAARGGGSDTNILNEAGIPSVNLGVGASNDHTSQESVTVQDLVNATKLVLGIIESVVERVPAGVRA